MYAIASIAFSRKDNSIGMDDLVFEFFWFIKPVLDIKNLETLS